MPVLCGRASQTPGIGPFQNRVRGLSDGKTNCQTAVGNISGNLLISFSRYIKRLTMNQKQNQVRIIGLLADHEMAVSKLYRIYSERFPNYEDFWSELSADETSHAKCIRELTSKIEQGLVYFNEERFQPAAIERSLQYIEQMQEKALQPDFSLINALSIASFIEDALIESEFFKVFEGDSAELQEVLHILASATSQHREKVHKALAEMKLQTH
jgi:hypothetical protein